MSWIRTASGRHFDLIEPKPHMVHLLDIACNLAKQCRFNGATKGWYSVARHSIIMSRHVPKELALQALMHDATEAYMGDVVKPFKNLLPGIDALEHTIWLAICERFNIEPELHPKVKEMDVTMLASERYMVMPRPKDEIALEDEWPGLGNWNGEVVNIRDKFDPMYSTWEQDEKAFVLRFMELYRGE